MVPQTPETFRFGEFELNVDSGELRRNNQRLKLQPQPFKLLVLLVRRAGNLVSREDIKRELWPDGTFVDFDQSVNFSIKQIRDVLEIRPNVRCISRRCLSEVTGSSRRQRRDETHIGRQ